MPDAVDGAVMVGREERGRGESSRFERGRSDVVTVTIRWQGISTDRGGKHRPASLHSLSFRRMRYFNISDHHSMVMGGHGNSAYVLALGGPMIPGRVRMEVVLDAS